MTSRTLINENRLFSNVRHFFKSVGTVWDELVQNGCRAKASTIWIDIDRDQNIVRYRDDGEGVQDLFALLCLGETQFSAEMMEQNPAGLGFMHILANSSSVEITSLFGMMTIDCERFFIDGEYRSGLLEHLEKAPSCEGLQLTIRGAERILEHYGSSRDDSIAKNLDLYPTTIILNGVPVERGEFLPEDWDRYVLPAGTVYIRKGVFSISRWTVSWYGQRVSMWVRGMGVDKDACLMVTEGTPLTLQLPDRSSIVEDEKFAAVERDLSGLLLQRALEHHTKRDKALEYLQRQCPLTFEPHAGDIRHWEMNLWGDSGAHGNPVSATLIKGEHIPDYLCTLDGFSLRVNGEDLDDLYAVAMGGIPNVFRPRQHYCHRKECSGGSIILPTFLRDVPYIAELRLSIQADVYEPPLLLHSEPPVLEGRIEGEDTWVPLPWEDQPILDSSGGYASWYAVGPRSLDVEFPSVEFVIADSADKQEIKEAEEEIQRAEDRLKILVDANAGWASFVRRLKHAAIDFGHTVATIEESDGAITFRRAI